jgi:hypothetical protein
MDRKARPDLLALPEAMALRVPREKLDQQALLETLEYQVIKEIRELLVQQVQKDQ